MIQDILKTIPKRPGIYLHKDAQGVILYVGKALSLRDRVSSYFASDVTGKTQELVKHIADISWVETGSDFEALLLEAKLIKLYRPKYNVTFRDDKSYLYIFVSTGEEFPKVFTTRKPKNFVASERGFELFDDLKGEYFGPFPSAGTTRSVLKWLRRAIPFCTQKSIGSRPCFYSHLGLCHPCPGFIVKQEEAEKALLKKEYRLNIFRLKRILEGNIDTVKKELLRDMQKFADEEKFEQAQELKTQYDRLEWILKNPPSTKSFLENPNFYSEESQKATEELAEILREYAVPVRTISKIECFDISTLQGTFSVAAQVVFVEGVPEKALYRRYKIKNDGMPNDFAMLAEAISRRLRHDEWPLPDLLIVDGGKGQVSTILKVLQEKKIPLPLIGLAKQFEKIIVPYEGEFKEVTIPKKSRALQLVQALRDEAHRFGIAYHRKRRNEGTFL